MWTTVRDSKKMLMKLTLIPVLAMSSSIAFADDAPAKPDAASQIDTVPAGLVQLPPNSRYYSPFAFVVNKSARTLAVWHQTGKGLTRVAEFPADLGAGSGDKKFEGDKKTPEGIYFLLEMLEGNKIDFKLYGKRAFTTDYPNYFDRREGKTGSGIWLHSVPDNVPLTRGSRGCVVVRNDVIVGLDQYIRLGRTPILIQNSTETLTPPQATKLNAELATWLNNWKSAWEAKNIDAYISAYGDEFHSMDMNMNREQWKTYKTNLNSQYKTITVRLSKPAILADRDRVIVRFLQEYTSDQHADFGEKVLFVKRTGDQFKIVGEQWKRETSKIAREEIEATTDSTTSTRASTDSTQTHASTAESKN
ncbi:MAG TPA: L,D-transpeptidase family protein [Bdellovibrionales bacterium]|nr:L,D-transpeptidase family protein [Bdellovibrionales bacterium]